MNIRTGVFAAALVAGITGCTGPTTQQVSLDTQLTREEVRYQQSLKLQRVIDYQRRVESVGAPLLKAALPFCPEHQGHYLGLKVDNLSAWPAEYRAPARDTLNLDEALRVTLVTPGSPAASAGLEVGDLVISVNGQHTIGGIGAVADYRQMLERVSGETIKLGIVRDREALQFEVTPQPACNYPLHVVMNNTINAYADGQNVVVTSGLIRFAESDAELAMVLAHEIAHNGKEHLEAQQANFSTGSVLDIVMAAYGVNTQGAFARLAARSYSREFEQEADYIGLYILARADVPIPGLEEFWRRVAAETPDANRESLFRSHPISAERTLAIIQATDEIELKRAHGEPLLPNE